MAAQSPHDSSKHPIVNALRLLVGDAADSTSTMLERSALTRALAKAIFTQPGAEPPPGSGATSWRARLDEARKAHAMLDGLFGGRRWLHIERWVTDHDPAVEVRPAARSTARPAPVAKAPVAARAPVAPPKPAGPKDSEEGQPFGEAGPPAPDPARAIPVRPAGPEPKLFGRYLHARGLITLSQLIAAVVWQRKSRPSVGQIAIQKELLSLTNVVEILRQRAPGELFLEAAVRCGYLDADQRLAILREQRTLQQRIGTYFVDHGILSRSVVESLAEEARAASEPGPDAPTT